MFSLEFSQSARKFLKKISRHDAEHIISVLERSRIRPEQHFERLVGVKLHKLRAGDYRIIADISAQKLIILVVKIGHRNNIYK